MVVWLGQFLSTDRKSGTVETRSDSVPASVQRILVVDDSRLERRIVAASLRKWGYDVVEAADAQTALDMCRVAIPDLIISDWMMPGMTGPDFCEVFRGLPDEAYTYFILLTSKSESSEIAHGLNAGADDFLTKPVNSAELRARIAAGDRILRMQRELSSKNDVISTTLAELQEVYEKIDVDLMQARKIQESLVPRLDQDFGPSRISLLLEPCGHIGGDLVGMFSPGSNRVGFYSIDVSGHGITSAMMTARLGSYLSSTHLDQNVAVEKRFDKFFSLRQPSDVAAHLNARLDSDTGIEEYFTMVYAIADLSNGLVKLVQAGHPYPLLLKHTGEMEFVGEGGAPVGLLPDIEFQQFEVQMSPGDRLLLYSDGLTECRLEDGDMLEEEGLFQMIQSMDMSGSREFLDDLFWRLTQRMGNKKSMDDDVSAALFHYLGPETSL